VTAPGTKSSPWLIVFGSALALMFGAIPILTYTPGLFMKPLQAEFGWNRTELSLGVSLTQSIGIFSVFAVGWAMDRWGVKRVIAPLIFLFAVNVALLATMSSLTMFVVLYVMFGVTYAGLSPVGFLKSISAFFDERRGLAIGLALSGTAIGATFVPRFAELMISAYGWRTAYIGLALLPALVALPATLLLVREPSAAPAVAAVEVPEDHSSSRDELPGLTIRQALATRAFWLLAATVFLVSAVINGTSTHAVPFLTDHGYTPAAAAAVLTGIGFASVVGRIGSGYLFDRFFAPYVATFFFVLMILGLYLLADLRSASLAMITVGLALGLELDILGYLVPRYFGLKRFGEIYGLMFGALNGGGAVGPLAMGAVYTAYGSYHYAFLAFAAMLLCACGLVCKLGPYVYERDTRASKR
jgi:predicted MFS family arabinose efflux permease